MLIFCFVRQQVLYAQFLNRSNASVFGRTILCYIAHTMRVMSTVYLCRIYATPIRSICAMALDGRFFLTADYSCGFEHLEFELSEYNLLYRLFVF